MGEKWALNVVGTKFCPIMESVGIPARFFLRWVFQHAHAMPLRLPETHLHFSPDFDRSGGLVDFNIPPSDVLTGTDVVL